MLDRERLLEHGVGLERPEDPRQRFADDGRGTLLGRHHQGPVDRQLCRIEDLGACAREERRPVADGSAREPVHEHLVAHVIAAVLQHFQRERCRPFPGRSDWKVGPEHGHGPDVAGACRHGVHARPVVHVVRRGDHVPERLHATLGRREDDILGLRALEQPADAGTQRRRPLLIGAPAQLLE